MQKRENIFVLSYVENLLLCKTLMEIQVIIQPVHKFLIKENFNNAVAANNASFDDIYLVIEIEFSLSV